MNEKYLKQITLDYEVYEGEIRDSYDSGFADGETRMLEKIENYLLGVPKEEVFHTNDLNWDQLLSVIGDIDKLKKH